VEGFFPAVHGAFSDGSLLVSVPPLTGKAPVSPGRAWRDTVTYLRIASTGQLLDSVGGFPGTEQYESPSPDRRTFRTVSLPFGRSTSVAVAGERFFVATGDEYRVDVFTPDGKPHSAVRRPVQPLTVTRADVAEYTRRVVDAAGSRADERRAELAAAPFPRTTSPTGAVLADEAGRLWVEDAQPMAELARGSRWSVFDSEGRWIARVEGPARFRPFQIGRDWVLGRYTDADGVQHVQLHRFTTAPGTR
jgi:DNA-binding beta-propeller fold protein YncE